MPHVTMHNGMHYRQIDTSDSATLAAWLVENLAQLSALNRQIIVEVTAPLWNLTIPDGGPDWPADMTKTFRAQFEEGAGGKAGVIGLREALAKYLETL